MIATIIGVVFWSQHSKAKGAGQNMVSDAQNQAKTIISDGVNWVKGSVAQKVAGGVQNGGEAIKAEVNVAQEKVSESVTKKISDYISGVGTAILHPGTPTNCPAPATTKP